MRERIQEFKRSNVFLKSYFNQLREGNVEPHKFWLPDINLHKKCIIVPVHTKDFNLLAFEM